MNVYIPWGLIAIFFAFYFSYSHNRRTRLRREERKEKLDNRNQELLDYLHRSNKAVKQDNMPNKEESVD